MTKTPRNSLVCIVFLSISGRKNLKKNAIISLFLFLLNLFSLQATTFILFKDLACSNSKVVLLKIKSMKYLFLFSFLIDNLHGLGNSKFSEKLIILWIKPHRNLFIRKISLIIISGISAGIQKKILHLVFFNNQICNEILGLNYLQLYFMKPRADLEMRLMRLHHSD